MAQLRKGRASDPTPDRSPVPGDAVGSADPGRAKDTTDSDISLVRPEERRYTCPACGSDNLGITHKVGRYGGWTVLVHCWGCGGGLDEVFAASGIARHKLLRWPPPKELGPSAQHVYAAGVAGAIDPARVDGWESALWSTRHALGYLRRRGLSNETIRKYKLGYDSDADAVVFPVYEEGELVRIKLRYLDPDADPKTWNSPGPGCLYPDMPKSRGVLLVAGEMDALTGRQMNLPTVTGTTGTSLKQGLANRFAKRVVYVMFDVGENHAAVRALNRLLIGDAEYVRIVQLARLGLPPKTDLNDFVVKHGGTREQIIRLINDARRAS